MTVEYTSQTKYFSGANDIKWSQIRDTFNSGATGGISASTYLRNTDKTADNPIVPDATENANISTNTNWNVSGFRNSIKEYVVSQSGTNSDLNLASSTYWNSNLNKNVKKRVNFGGISYASSKNNYAVSIAAEHYNLDMTVSGQMYGQGGNRGSVNGGSVLYVYNTSSRTGNTSYADVVLTTNGRIWSGGGAGSDGSGGTAGPAATCNYSGNFNTANPHTGGQSLGSAQPGDSCRRARAGSTWSSATQNSVRSRCRGGSSRRGNGEYPNGPYQCSPHWTITCAYTYSNTVNSSGGSGGLGGPGQGYSNNTVAGNPGNAGNTGTCAAPATGSSVGNSGNPGNSGGAWGTASAGAAGYSIYGNRYTVTGETSTRIKGPKGYN